LEDSVDNQEVTLNLQQGSTVGQWVSTYAVIARVATNVLAAYPNFRGRYFPQISLLYQQMVA